MLTTLAKSEKKLQSWEAEIVEKLTDVVKDLKLRDASRLLNYAARLITTKAVKVPVSALANIEVDRFNR